MTDTTPPEPPDYQQLRREIAALAAECDRQYPGTRILETLLGAGVSLDDVPDYDLEPLLDRLYEELKRHDAVGRANDE
jgi:hypothetical protein